MAFTAKHVNHMKKHVPVAGRKNLRNVKANTVARSVPVPLREILMSASIAKNIHARPIRINYSRHTKMTHVTNTGEMHQRI